MSKNILSIDIGTTCGWAYYSQGFIQSGSINFKAKTSQNDAQKYINFKNWLIEFINNEYITHVYYEQVMRHLGTAAAHTYGGFCAVMKMILVEKSIPYESVPVKTIKKFITGKGTASKENVISAINNRNFYPKDHNEADALALLFYSLNGK